MNDQTIPADKVRKIAAEMRAAMRRDDDTYRDAQFLDDMSGYIRDLDKLCARARPLPTLAGMTPEERAACQWMQADVRNFDRRMVITEVRTSSADLIERDGERWNATFDRVTPRPDLPRMEWPEATPVAPGHLTVGTVIESAADPRIAALPDGSILLDRDRETVAKRHGEWVGIGYIPIPSEGDKFGPWKVLRIQKEEE